MATTHTRFAPALAALTLLGAGTLAAQPAGIPGKAFVVNQADSSVSLVDINSMKVLRTIPVGNSPYFVSVSGDQTTLAVAVEEEKRVKFYDTKDFHLKGECEIGKMYAEHMMELPDGKTFLMANRFGNQILEISFAEMKIVNRIPEVNAPHNIRLGATGKYVFATSKINPGVSIIDLQNRKVIRFISTKYIPRGLAFSPDDKYVYCGANWVNGMFEYETETGKFVRFVQTPLTTGNTEVVENTYHGFEPVNDSVVIGTLEGLSALDVMNAHTGALISRNENVQMPSAVLKWPGKPDWYIFTNMKSSTVQSFHLTRDYKIELGPSVKCGLGRIELPKRFCFFWG